MAFIEANNVNLSIGNAPQTPGRAQQSMPQEQGHMSGSASSFYLCTGENESTDLQHTADTHQIARSAEQNTREQDGNGFTNVELLNNTADGDEKWLCH